MALLEDDDAFTVNVSGSEARASTQCATSFQQKLQGYKFVSSSAALQLPNARQEIANEDGRELVSSASSSTAKSAKRRRQNTGDAHRRDTRAKYAHLPELTDALAPNLLVMFIGLNPGLTTAELGQPYAHPSNLFWKLLHTSGLTERRYRPEEHVNLPKSHRLGFTNIVSRPTKNGSELSKSEMIEGTPILEAKARQWRPVVCCLVGKGIWEAIWKYRQGRALSKADFKYGFQDEAYNLGVNKDWNGARVFVAASTSGLSASLSPAEKEAIWASLGDWAKNRRQQDLK